MATSATVSKQQKIQREQDSKDKARSKKPASKPKPAVQTSMKKQPAPPIPRNHLQKPGTEADLDLAPQFLAKGYKGSGKLAGMKTIITGGDSGIGRAVAVLFAREGADVAIIYLNENSDAKETRRHVEAEGRQCLLLPGDVKDAAFCRKAVAKAVKTFGKLDVLVNNAAFQMHADSLGDLTEERFDETMKTNVLDQGIRVNAVAPGPVWTPLNPADKSSPDIEQFGSQSDYRRPAQPEEISPAYVFLASAACSSYITGIVLPITGSVG